MESRLLTARGLADASCIAADAVTIQTCERRLISRQRYMAALRLSRYAEAALERVTGPRQVPN